VSLRNKGFPENGETPQFVQKSQILKSPEEGERARWADLRGN
jgi:hypothetical protein